MGHKGLTADETVPAGGPARAVTLHDVAREAGVAVSTVSRALSNPERVGARTRERVQAVARRMDYRPNRIAQALPRGRTQMLALLVSDITNPHNFGLVRGAEAQASAAGFLLVLGDTQGSPELESDHVCRLSSVVDGFVLASSRLPDADLLQLQGRRSVVLFNREVDGFPSVVTDSVGGSRQIVEHLAALGHRSIAYLAGPSDAWADGVRWRALSSHAEDAGIEIARLGPFSPTVDHGSVAADVGLSSGATALVAFNDLLAIGVLRRLERRGVDVPGEVSVAGYDDIFGSDFCHPPLTTVTSPVEQAGRAVIDLLLGARSARPGLVLPADLRVRESSGPAPSTTIP
ncbi:MAG: LacI family transcriptional regulator [Pseudonocardia sp.]|nr:LacI family transcriptional regulator [Pseudonocardia sp.]